MANFPTSLDTLTNPTSGNTLDNPSHSLQHSDANDILEALEAKVGIGSSTAGSATTGNVLVASTGGTTSWTTIGTASITSGTATNGQVLTANGSGGVSFGTLSSSGLVKIASTSYSAVSSQAFDGVFSSTYRAYIVEIRQTTSTNNNCTIKYRAGGATDSTLNYNYQRAEFNNTTVSASRSLSNDGYGPFAFSSQVHIVDAIFVDPNGSDAYKGLHTRVFTGSEMSYMSGRFNTTTSFDGFILTANTGTITGTTTIWGLVA
jgi:hypothetical protein